MKRLSATLSIYNLQYATLQLVEKVVEDEEEEMIKKQQTNKKCCHLL